MELAEIPDVMLSTLVVGLLAIHSLKEETEVIQLARQMFRSDSVVSRFNAFRSIWLAGFLKMKAMDIATIPPEYIMFGKNMLLELWAPGEEPWVILSGRRFLVGYTEYAIITEYMSKPLYGSTFIDDLLQLQWHKEESERIVHIIHALEVTGQYGYPLQALNDMRRWFRISDPMVHKALVEGLAKIRVTHPDEVDLYLADNPDLFRETQEMPGVDWKGAGLGPALYQAGHLALIGILRISTIRKGMLNALVQTMQTAQCLEDAMKILTNWVFNKVLPQIIEQFREK